MNQIPHFIIVGAMKSGTTTLGAHLNNHEKIHVAPNELHFFDSQKNFDKGMDWYREKLLEGKSDDACFVGEKTPTYSYMPGMEKRIHEAVPHAKIIWIFRNPVKRAYSNYLHRVKKGVEKLTFEKTIENESKRIKRNIFYGYRTRSIYHEQVQRYLEYFPMEQMHFILFEDLIKPYSKNHALNDLFQFIGVDSERFNYKEVHSHKTVMPRFPKLLYYTTQAGLMEYSPIHRAVTIINGYKKDAGYPKMNAEIQEELYRFFRPHNERLSELIDMDLSAWDKPC
ncbi:sulfotransferase family protein [Rhodohalobacter sp. 8-1]|uniref:sulfotransferase family protein n=1 Tax=Rhodohalobacter sp. 8-1 TaxID=3131972 RepID=UPI0030EB7DEE